MQSIRVGVAGAGSFGSNHLRVLRELPGVTLAGVTDADPARAAEASAKYGCPMLTLDEMASSADACVVATPTVSHTEVGCRLLEAGLDVMVEKPIAPDRESARRLVETAAKHGRILQVGHLERFNPAIRALQSVATLPLFFEIHRMSVFTPRSLDVDVVLDLMIHDVDILLSLCGDVPSEIRAAGIRILSQKVDIANVRLAFANGCVANLTASRASVEKIRKMRLFQPGEYVSVDYTRQDISKITVRDGEVGFEAIEVEKSEPLRLELESFVDCVRDRSRPVVSGEDATRALEVCLDILSAIEEHGRLVQDTIAAHGATVGSPYSS
ncbi:MAG: Gfo/Idh/MocA family oxidoreductase [Bryobacteraceae bacterium]|nr:Gfo/Idh/MocA family oxidoreductase [Bryobacteraceae bacterium]